MCFSLQSSLFRLVLVFGVLQAAFWFLFYPSFVSPPRPAIPFIAVEQLQYAAPESVSAQALKDAEFSSFVPGREHHEAGYHAVRASFQLEAVPEKGLALLSISGGDNAAQFVNGSFVGGRGSFSADDPAYRGNLREILLVPPASLAVGRNTVTTVSVLETGRAIVLAPALLADYSIASQEFAWREFLQNDFHKIVATATFVLALLVAIAALRTSEPALPGWLSVLTFSWAAFTFIPIWTNPPFGGVARIWLYEMTYTLFLLAWPCFVDEWSKRPLRGFKTTNIVVFGSLAFVGTALAVFFSARYLDYFSDVILTYAGILSVGATALRLVWHFITERNESRVWEGGFMLMLLFLSGWHIYDFLVEGRTDYMLTRATPFLFLALVVGFFAGRFHLFRSAEQINTVLKEKLDEREAQLADAHAREKQFIRIQAYGEERQRIMRDMHDGLGSQLMGMLLAARRGKADPDRVAQGLQQVIDELRLMIDSMDSVGESLASALAGFRNRLQPRVEDAGFTFIWDDRLAGKEPNYPPRKTLQLFRIIQEAVTNALKHSEGATVSIRLGRNQSNELEVLVQDDGQGISGPRIGGHGLENMDARASKEGGSIELGRSEIGGGEVRIRFPVPETTTPAEAR